VNASILNTFAFTEAFETGTVVPKHAIFSANPDESGAVLEQARQYKIGEAVLLQILAKGELLREHVPRCEQQHCAKHEHVQGGTRQGSPATMPGLLVHVAAIVKGVLMAHLGCSSITGPECIPLVADRDELRGWPLELVCVQYGDVDLCRKSPAPHAAMQ
jgi:hypothetical protein